MVHWWFISKIGGYPKIVKGEIISQLMIRWAPPVAVHQQAWLACRKGLWPCTAPESSEGFVLALLQATLIFSTYAGYRNLFLKATSGRYTKHLLSIVCDLYLDDITGYTNTRTEGTCVWNMSMCVHTYNCLHVQCHTLIHTIHAYLPLMWAMPFFLVQLPDSACNQNAVPSCRSVTP